MPWPFVLPPEASIFQLHTDTCRRDRGEVEEEEGDEVVTGGFCFDISQPRIYIQPVSLVASGLYLVSSCGLRQSTRNARLKRGRRKLEHVLIILPAL